VFTPNNDGENDFFKPISNRFVESIEFIIYNRWGKTVFTTTDPSINWDGNDYLSGQPCSEGVYYYVCKVNEIRLTGLETRTLEGFFHLFR
jgi:gliding motility-associated-like protein